MYKLIKSPFDNSTIAVFNIETKTSIPLSEENIDYQEYLKWLSEGNQPLPADEPTEI